MPSHMALKTPIMCPHKDSKRWLRTFLDEAGMGSFVLRKDYMVYALGQCNCSVAEKKFDSYHDLQLQVKRVV